MTSSNPSSQPDLPERPRGVPMPIFYAVLALITIGGVALLMNNLGVLRESALADQRGRSYTTTLPLDSLPARGSPDAPVTVIEFADYDCPDCQLFANQIAPAILRDFVDTGKARLLFHDNPLKRHVGSVPAAEAARCAGDQGAYWQMHDALYANLGEWRESAAPGALFAGYAEQLGLDRAAFERCTGARTHQAAVQAAYEAAVRAGVTSTPIFVIDGKPYNYNQLRGGIEAALAAR